MSSTASPTHARMPSPRSTARSMSSAWNRSTCSSSTGRFRPWATTWIGDPVITAVADRLGRTAAQVTLRWHLQRGDVVFPKSVTRARVDENIALFDFELTDADLRAITALNRDERTGPNPDEFNRVP